MAQEYMGTRGTEERILIARIGALGDTLMATPVIRACRESCPGARIDFLSSSPAAPLLRFHPDLSQVHVLKSRNVPYLLSPEKWRLAAAFRQRSYARAVLLESAQRYLDLLERGGLKTIDGFHEVPSDPTIHSAANNLRAARFSDWAQRPLHSDLHFPAEAAERARQLTAGLRPPVVGVHPGYGPAHRKSDQSERLKGWPTAAFRDLLGRLLSSGRSVVLTGSGGDRAEALRISEPHRGHERLRILAGSTTVPELAAMISGCALFVSVDSGPAHMAAAVGTPLIVLWGPAKLHQVQPISSGGLVRVLRNPVPCAPCYDTPAMKACLDNICMKGIVPEMVFEAVEEVLS